MVEKFENIQIENIPPLFLMMVVELPCSIQNLTPSVAMILRRNFLLVINKN
jgi:hypothetical protein